MESPSALVSLLEIDVESDTAVPGQPCRQVSAPLYADCSRSKLGGRSGKLEVHWAPGLIASETLTVKFIF